MMETDFRNLLANAPALLALLCDRVYFQSAPQNERRPRLLIRLSHYQHRTIDKGATNDWTTQASIDALAPTYREACELTAAVQKTLQDIRFRSETNTFFRHIAADDAEDIPVMPIAGDAKPTFGRNLRARIEWRPRGLPGQ